MTTLLNVQGMSCDNCVKHVREALESISGVERAEVDLNSATATVDHNHADLEAMLAALVDEGYEASVK